MWSVPGGSPKAGEAYEEAAAREAFEEIGFTLDPALLASPVVINERWEYRDDTVHIFEIELAEKPALTPDGREILEAGFFRPEAISGLKTPRHLQRYLAQATSRTASG
jgi:8-oxo-dGTP diphosphatase